MLIGLCSFIPCLGPVLRGVPSTRFFFLPFLSSLSPALRDARHAAFLFLFYANVSK